MKSGCIGCNADFTGMTLFEAHRVGKYGVKEGENRRRCMTKSEMEAKGWQTDQKGAWFDPRARLRLAQFSTQRDDPLG